MMESSNSRLLTSKEINELFTCIETLEKTHQNWLLDIQKERTLLMKKGRKLIKEIKKLLVKRDKNKNAQETNKVKRGGEQVKKIIMQKSYKNASIKSMNIEADEAVTDIPDLSKEKKNSLPKKVPVVKVTRLSSETLRQHGYIFSDFEKKTVPLENSERTSCSLVIPSKDKYFGVQNESNCVLEQNCSTEIKECPSQEDSSQFDISNQNLNANKNRKCNFTTTHVGSDDERPVYNRPSRTYSHILPDTSHKNGFSVDLSLSSSPISGSGLSKTVLMDNILHGKLCTHIPKEASSKEYFQKEKVFGPSLINSDSKSNITKKYKENFLLDETRKANDNYESLVMYSSPQPKAVHNNYTKHNHHTKACDVSQFSVLRKGNVLVKEKKHSMIKRDYIKDDYNERKRRYERNQENFIQKIGKNRCTKSVHIEVKESSGSNNICHAKGKVPVPGMPFKDCHKCCPFIKLEKLTYDVLKQYIIPQYKRGNNVQLLNNKALPADTAVTNILNVVAKEEMFPKKVPVVNVTKLTPRLLRRYGYIFPDFERKTVSITNFEHVSCTLDDNSINKNHSTQGENNYISKENSLTVVRECSTQKCRFQFNIPNENFKTSKNEKCISSARVRSYVGPPLFKKPKLMMTCSDTITDTCYKNGFSLSLNSCNIRLEGPTNTSGLSKTVLVNKVLHGKLSTQIQKGTSDNEYLQNDKELEQPLINHSTKSDFMAENIGNTYANCGNRLYADNIIDEKENYDALVIHSAPLPKAVLNDHMKRNNSLQSQTTKEVNFTKAIVTTHGNRKKTMSHWARKSNQNLELLMKQSYIPKDLLFRFMGCSKPYPEMSDLFGCSS